MDMTIEIWKSIPEYEGYYQVSNRGNIRSVDRVINMNGRFDIKLFGKLMKQKICNYKQIHFRRNNKNKYFLVHRLVALVFIPNPDNKPHVNHLDGNKFNNNDWNLAWATEKENMQHAADNNLLCPNIGVESTMSKLTDLDVLEIRNKFSVLRYNVKTLSKEYGVSTSLIHMVTKGKKWKHVGGVIKTVKLGRSGSNAGRAKLIDLDIPVIKKMYSSENKSCSEIAKIFDIDQSSIWNIIKCKTWKHVA